MTSYVLEITLRTPLTSAAGEGRVGLVDRDVVFDDYELPILPGRRIKGLWSEAYQEVVDAWTLCGQDAVRSTAYLWPNRTGPRGWRCAHARWGCVSP